MTNSTELPPVFCANAVIAGLSGPGDCIQMTFMSPIATEAGVVEIPVFRTAMGREAFAQMLDAMNRFHAQLNAATTEAAKKLS